MKLRIGNACWHALLNPELIKRFWKAAIRGYHFMRVAPENYPFVRFVEARLRTNNPDEAECMRDLTPMVMMESQFFPIDGQLAAEGVWRILEEHQDPGAVKVNHARRRGRGGAAGSRARSLGGNVPD